MARFFSLGLAIGRGGAGGTGGGVDMNGGTLKCGDADGVAGVGEGDFWPATKTVEIKTANSDNDTTRGFMGLLSRVR
jgi:hypothetical protein